MEENNLINENNKKKLGIILGLGGFIVLIIVFIIMGTFGNKKEELYETKKVIAYSSRMHEAMEKVKEMNDVQEAKSYVVSEIYDANEVYGGNDSVDFVSNQMLVTVMSDESTSIEDFLSSLTNSLNNVVDDINNGVDDLVNNDNNILKSTLVIKSKTVCEDENIDNKYCVDNLNARIYVVDKNSDKWAVLVHGYMMSGSLIYSALGDMYAEQGYNVIAPDLRGFGSSDGSVAMGYLESLDIYDWIKDLNANWKDRYGVTKAPSSIVVHGISLGGATTLQLATNLDIAAANNGPYTQNLTSLNVKGFVDDCGYTSMSGIITGMLSMGEMVDLTAVLGSLNIDLDQFMGEFKKVTEMQNIPGFDEFDISNFENTDFSEIYTIFERFSEEFSSLQDEFNKYIEKNGNYEIPGMSETDIKEMLNYSFNYTSDEAAKDKLEDVLNDYNGITYSQNNVIRLNSSNSSEQVLEGLVAKALMNLVGVGLTEQNYSKYSNVFSDGRKFVSGSKVMIIHGTADTTVPHVNADIVAKNVNPGVLVHKWDAENQPHAFVVVGIKKDEYKTLVANYVNCIDNSSCTSITR